MQFRGQLIGLMGMDVLVTVGYSKLVRKLLDR